MKKVVITDYHDLHRDFLRLVWDHGFIAERIDGRWYPGGKDSCSYFHLGDEWIEDLARDGVVVLHNNSDGSFPPTPAYATHCVLNVGAYRRMTDCHRYLVQRGFPRPPMKTRMMWRRLAKGDEREPRYVLWEFIGHCPTTGEIVSEYTGAPWRHVTDPLVKHGRRTTAFILREAKRGFWKRVRSEGVEPPKTGVTPDAVVGT